MFGIFPKLSLCRHMTLFVALIATIFISVPEAAAQKGGLRLPFGRKPKIEQTNFDLTQKAGPWLIMCTSFVGQGAELRANQIAQEVQTELNVPVYVYKQNFDFSNKYQGIWYSSQEWSEDENGNRTPVRKQTKLATESRFEEYAVLVGDFPSLEDSKCQKTLESIKYLPLASTIFTEEASDEHNIKEWRESIKNLKKSARKKGPLGAAFVIPNPVIPEEYFAQSQVDDTILELNRGNDYSLLDCPKQYSVRVATFRGSITMDLQEIEQEENKFNLLKRIGKPISQSKLADSTRKCGVLCKELRKMGVEAYAFHDSTESYVCVGSFDWVSRKNSLGEIEFNEDVQKTILMFKGFQENVPNSSSGFTAKSLPALAKENIAFDIQPVPVEVPRASPSRTARGGIMGSQFK